MGQGVVGGGLYTALACKETKRDVPCSQEQVLKRINVHYQVEWQTGREPRSVDPHLGSRTN